MLPSGSVATVAPTSGGAWVSNTHSCASLLDPRYVRRISRRALTAAIVSTSGLGEEQRCYIDNSISWKSFIRSWSTVERESYALLQSNTSTSSSQKIKAVDHLG